MVFTHALICFRKMNERVYKSTSHEQICLFYRHRVFFIYTVETQATYLFIKHSSVSFDNNCTVQSTTRIYFLLTLKKFITKSKFRQQNVFIPLAFHIKCENNFNNSKTQRQAKNIKVYIF